MKIWQIAQGNSRRIHCRHDQLWADMYVSLHRRLLVMNRFRGFDADNPENIVRFSSVKFYRLLSDDQLHKMRIRASILVSPQGEDSLQILPHSSSQAKVPFSSIYVPIIDVFSPCL